MNKFKIGDEVSYKETKAIVIQIFDEENSNSIVLVKSPISGEFHTDYWYLPGTNKTGNHYDIENMLNNIERKN